MKRVLVVSMGPPCHQPGPMHAGPALRAQHLVTALERDGFEVMVLCVDSTRRSPVLESERVATAASTFWYTVAESDFGADHLDALVSGFSPASVVGVGVYASSLATGLATAAPLWADCMGDLMAEAQAKAVATGSDFALAHFWSLLRPVLDRADRYSAVSEPGADALRGQLGLAGRLGWANAASELVEVIPLAAEVSPGSSVSSVEAQANSFRSDLGQAANPPARGSGLRGNGVPEDAFVVLWSGGFNTWCDVATLLEGLHLAMDKDPSLHCVASGGAIPGHDEDTHARFRRQVEGGPHRDRIHLLGWTHSSRLPVLYAEADLGLVVERRLLERRFGGETRLVEWMAAGLPALTSAQSSFGRSMVLEGVAFGFEVGSPRSLAEQLLRLSSAREDLAGRAEACRRYAAEHLNFSVTAAPLLRWCAAPTSASDHDTQRVIQIGLVNKPETMLKLLEGYLEGLGLARSVYRGGRWVLRRVGSALARGWSRGIGSGD